MAIAFNSSHSRIYKEDRKNGIAMNKQKIAGNSRRRNAGNCSQEMGQHRCIVLLLVIQQENERAAYKVNRFTSQGRSSSEGSKKESEVEESIYDTDSFEEDMNGDSSSDKNMQQLQQGLIGREAISGLDKESRDILRESINQAKVPSTEQETSPTPELLQENISTPSALRAKPKLVPLNFQNMNTPSRFITDPQPQLISNTANKNPGKHRKKQRNETEQIINQVFRRLKRFDRHQLDKLIRMLDKIEHNTEQTKLPRNQNELVFRVKSTWGHSRIAGLTEIMLFDVDGGKVTAPCFARNNELSPAQPISKLFDEEIFTTEEDHMWIGSVPPLPYYLEIVFELPLDCKVGGIVVWNYNKGQEKDDYEKGVKDAEILLNGYVLWRGEIKKGEGKINEDYSTEIVLIPQPFIFNNKPKPPQHPEKVSLRPISVPTHKKIIAEKLPDSSLAEPLPRFESSKNKRIIIRSHPVNMVPKIPREKTINTVEPITIPELPKGETITFIINSTWGDQSCVGLAGIEIFDSNGTAVRIDKSQIKATVETDCSTVDKLIDGVYFTKDDTHVWLSPFTAGEKHRIKINLGKETTLAMIRIWNYNKSRIHSFRGVKDATITLDGCIIFEGEIKRAAGELTDIRECCEVIMFTENPGIINAISQNDWINLLSETEDYFKDDKQERPISKAIIVGSEVKPIVKEEQIELGAVFIFVREKQQEYGRALTLKILETWGDLFYVGLTGIELLGTLYCNTFLLDNNKTLIPLHPFCITATPLDLSVIPGYSGDYRTIDKLLDGCNITTNDRHMWLIPFNHRKTHFITIKLSESQKSGLGFIRIYNYNKSPEDTFRGAKRIMLYLDGISLCPDSGIYIPKAPGHAYYDFAYTIPVPFKEKQFTNTPTSLPIMGLPLAQYYEPSNTPMGFSFEVHLYSTYKDSHFIGLNNIEIYGTEGEPLLCGKHKEHDLAIIPSPIYESTGDETENKNIWLASFKNAKLCHESREFASETNKIVVTFNVPVGVSAVKLWNYSKVPSRGVKEFAIFCDSALVFRVTFTTQTIRQQGIMKKSEQGKPAATVAVFTSDPKVLNEFKDDIIKHPRGNQDVGMIDEGNKGFYVKNKIEAEPAEIIKRSLTKPVNIQF
eukprot:TRINITY_DN71032_c0_g1_i1.p1 TRINITY_DN71032_c0_g1~~TRINITY_DN71032_c0_g1_i1.p1  ORF type:complete len:1123 (+),score=56.15 TRINITY_DN71032_c0_g1_i1:1477-4845(+)